MIIVTNVNSDVKKNNELVSLCIQDASVGSHKFDLSFLGPYGASWVLCGMRELKSFESINFPAHLQAEMKAMSEVPQP